MSCANVSADPVAFEAPGDEQPIAAGLPVLDLDDEHPERGLAQLVLSLVKLIHELLEKQAIRRMDAGRLSDEEIERLGTTLMRQAEAIETLRQQFGLETKDLDLLIDISDLTRR
jgi:hypothetical protein